MYSATDVNYINTALRFITMQGIHVIEVKSRGVSAQKRGLEVALEVTCDVQTIGGIKRHVITFTPSSITVKKGVVTRRDFILPQQTSNIGVNTDIQTVYDKINLLSLNDYDPSYYTRNNLMTLLLQSGVIDFSMGEDTLSFFTTRELIPLVRVEYQNERNNTFTYTIRTSRCVQNLKSGGKAVSYNTFYNDLRRFLTVR